jgi:hypothetical protein
MTHLVEQFNEINIVFLLSEVLLEKEVDRRFNHESVVDSDVSNFWLYLSVYLLSIQAGQLSDLPFGTNKAAHAW